jgi:hypothetical protein
LSIEGLDYASQINCRIVITLDCGIKAVEKVKYARTKASTSLSVIIITREMSYQRPLQSLIPSNPHAAIHTRSFQDAE